MKLPNLAKDFLWKWIMKPPDSGFFEQAGLEQKMNISTAFWKEGFKPGDPEYPYVGHLNPSNKCRLLLMSSNTHQR